VLNFKCQVEKRQKKNENDLFRSKPLFPSAISQSRPLLRLGRALPAAHDSFVQLQPNTEKTLGPT